MYQKAPTDMCPTDFAVNIKNVSKSFVQWQRDHTKKSLIRNLFKPEKRIITALDDVSFQIPKGSFVAYAGPNGAGKSTTMKLLSGMLLPTSGEIAVLNRSPQKERCALMQSLGVLFGNRTELWWDHPVIQSFEWKKVVWNIPEKEYNAQLERVVSQLAIGDLLKTFARELSLGQRMKADLALMLLHRPTLILLDEPTLGLDVVAKRQMIDFLKEINETEGVTIVVTSHDMDDLEEMAQRILMIAGGKVAFDGRFEGLRHIIGNVTRIVVTMAPGAVPRLEGGVLLSANQGVYEFEMDLASTPIPLLLRQLSAVEGIQDVEIKKVPIEQVIGKLYERWKSQ